MPSKLGPEGKWKTVGLSLREADLERLDAIRGECNRSEWIRPFVLAALDKAEREQKRALKVQGG